MHDSDGLVIGEGNARFVEKLKPTGYLVVIN